MSKVSNINFDYSDFISQLKEVRDYYKITNDPRSYGYDRALFSLQEDGAKEHLIAGDKLYGVGPAISGKWQEFMQRGSFEKIDEIRPLMCEMLNKESANPHKHYTPRDEVNEIMCQLIDIILNHVGYQYNKPEGGITFDICGSYRRGARYCGDGDLLISSDMDIALSVIDAIEASGLYTFHSKGTSKLKIICKEDNFEIDVRFCNPNEIGSFLLHMTGNGTFNVQLRHKAKELGYSLSEYGLYELSTQKLLKFKTEEEIFEKLGVKFVKPENRDY